MADKASNKEFDSKWIEALSSKGDEFSLFIPEGKKPKTQRQLILSNYFRIIRVMVLGHDTNEVLELGAGRGTISLYFNKYLNSNVTVNDISEDAINLARANFKFHSGKAAFIVGDAGNLPLPDDSFDVIATIGLLEHDDHYDRIIAEAYRLLRPGGIFASLNIPQKRSIQILNTAYRHLLKIVTGIPVKKDYHRNIDSPEKFQDEFIRKGFIRTEILRVTPFPIFTPVPTIIEFALTIIYRVILSVRSVFMRETFSASQSISQAHFIFARKPIGDLNHRK